MSDVLIVGGGFTGIVTSTFIKDKKVTLYEASKNLGGILRDYIIGDSVFFSSCQYFEEDSFWSKELKLTKDFYKFEHLYGSYTDIFGKVSLSKTFAGPVYSGKLDITIKKNSQFISLEDRLKIYPKEIAFPLLDWFKHIGVSSNNIHHSVINAFQASRIYCEDMTNQINLIKSNYLGDQIYGLPRKNINVKKLFSYLPKHGFNNFFDKIKLNQNIDIKLGSNSKPILKNKKIYLKNDNDVICPKLLIWTANPTHLFRKLFDVRLDSLKHYNENLCGYLEAKVETPFYIQVFSSHTKILRIYVYNINGKGCFTIEKAYDDSKDFMVLDNAQEILSKFYPYKILKSTIRKKSIRYFVYSIRDYELIKYYQNNDIDNLIFTDFLSYARNDKIKSILEKLTNRQ